MKKPKLIDNNRFFLRDVLIENAPDHKHLSIATGYWDLPGTAEIIDSFKNYESIRLLIGVEPHLSHTNELFPDSFIKADLQSIASLSESKNNERMKLYRDTAKTITQLIDAGILKVKIFRTPRLHAKAYVFGNETDKAPIGIIGSSNFTKAGLISSAELNSLEDQPPMVVYSPPTESMSHTHLSWFNKMWNNEEAIEWGLSFKAIVQDSPTGNLTFGAYDVYIKTLMMVYEDEMYDLPELDSKSKDVLFNFQERNAGILISKLERMKVAILADSVGLGKTITAGAVIRHYLNNNVGDIQIITPASLKQQWMDDLSERLEIDHRDGGFEILSMQDTAAIEKTFEYYNRKWRQNRKIGLFVIDEAHNLRSSSGIRREKIIELLQQHPDAAVLLLTATPINNSLLDLVNQIELALKGKLFSVGVNYKRPTDKSYEMIDFFEALKRIQSLASKAEKKNIKFDYNDFKQTLQEGLRKYLVRSTRQGIEAEAQFDPQLKIRTFPKSLIQSVEYSFSPVLLERLNKEIDKSNLVLENIASRKLNLNYLASFTMMSMHPLDLIHGIDSGKMDAKVRSNKKILESAQGSLYLNESSNSYITGVLQLVFLLGFPVYRPEVYNHKYHSKNLDELRELRANERLGIQLTVHNILRVTWLKRLESSTKALSDSLNNYLKRITLFEKYLDKGIFVTLSDAEYLDSEYGDGTDLDRAFEDYTQYLEDDKSIADKSSLKKRGIERRDAKPETYDLKSLRNDIKRDRDIVKLIITILSLSTQPDFDAKMIALAKQISDITSNGKYGKKVLVFSFFADTVHHLEKNLLHLMNKSNSLFGIQSAFLSGQTKDINHTVSLFSPNSKKYTIKPNEDEINYLFSTDVLSEGQNLQDSAYLINYDLHWNPVRMIQRNGRINRLGSSFSEVLVQNMRPTEDIEFYLKLVNRLENKINVIKNVVGLDQGVLNTDDVNPIEFLDTIYSKGEIPDPDDDLLSLEDDHIFELRKFLSNESIERKEFVKAIPLGKWNLLPDRSNVVRKTLAMEQVKIDTQNSNLTFNEYVFTMIDCKNEYRGDFIDTKTALDVMHTSSKDNDRFVDNIEFDRATIERISASQAKREAKNNPNSNKLKPAETKFLTSFKLHKNSNLDLRKLFEESITDSVEKKEFERVVKKGNKEIKEQGVFNVSTLSDMNQLIKKLQQKDTDSRVISGTRGVLYYAGKK
jgi:superfamily II DNA/RNA helicase/ATP:corrinoid adenosyltransferase